MHESHKERQGHILGMYESPKASHKQECSFPWSISVDTTETLPLHSEEPN